MSDDTSIFGAQPEKLDRLLLFGLEPPRAEDDATPTASVDMLLEDVGSWIDRYKLLEVLGEGGMGIVYLAEQAEPIQRQVALKVIKPGMDSARVIARFEAERQALARLDHPNIAHVHDAGTTEAGRPYFVMEYVEGPPITEYCDERKLSIEQRLRLFQQVCDAVQHAHQKGIIHRDIKPSNILVAAEGDKAIPKIIDFGVAKAIAEPLTARTLATEESGLLGTPEYMSPELADMASEDIDTRSDVYSLGVLLYVLLTGALPFDAKALREHGIEHIRKTIRETDPKTPSTRFSKLGEQAKKIAENRGTQVRALARHLRKELEWIPLKAMRKERSERYRSASELADDIENYLTHRPLIAGPPGTVYRLKKFVRRNGTLSAAVLVVAVTLILGLVATTAMYLRAERALGREAQARVEAQAIVGFLTQDVLGTVSDANAHEQTVSYVLDAASKNLEGKFDNQPLVEASIRNTLGWTYRRLGEKAKAVQHLERALEICEEHLGEGHLQTILKMFALGHAYMAQNRWDDAYRILSRQLQIVQREHATDFQAPYNALGCLYTHMGRYKEAEESFLKKLELIQKYDEDGFFAWGNLNLAKVYRCQGRYEEAEQLYLKTLAVVGWGPESSTRLGHTAALANVYRDQGRYEEGEQLYKTTLEKQLEVYGEERAVDTMAGLARLYTDQGRYEEADELFDKMLEITRPRADEERENRGWLGWCNDLAVLRTKQGRFDEAEHLFEEVSAALKLELGELADDHPRTLETINDLGVLRREQKRYDEAESLLRQALEGKQRKLGPDHPACFESRHELAVLRIRQARYEEAEPLLLEAFHGRETELGPKHPHTISSLRELVGLYESWNKPDGAAKWRTRLEAAENK